MICVRRFQTTNPARGRKLFSGQHLFCEFYISNHKPRKGTETTGNYLVYRNMIQKFQTTNPARGRKLFTIRTICSTCPVISNHKPRKGTETFRDVMRFNNGFQISNHKPRKGTETCTCRAHSDTHNTNFKPQTPQGDGNS